MPDGSEVTQEGILRGSILSEPIGNHGFGYDPIFLPNGSEFSLAQLDAGAKDAISHKGSIHSRNRASGSVNAWCTGVAFSHKCAFPSSTY